MNILYQILLVTVTVGFFIASNVIASQWAKTNQHWLWFPIFISACIGYVLFGYLIRQTNLSITSGLVDALIVIISILIGIFIVKDAVTTKQIIGLILAIFAVILIL